MGGRTQVLRRVEPRQHENTLARFSNDAFSWLGKRPISEIDAPEILETLKRVDGRDARYTARRLRGEISRVFRYTIKEGFCQSAPARDLVGAIAPAKTTHFASIIEPDKVGEMLRAFDGLKGTFPVLCELRLPADLFQGWRYSPHGSGLAFAAATSGFAVRLT